jgi:photosystem II stability/assembly factor-like uncharacterized protein
MNRLLPVGALSLLASACISYSAESTTVSIEAQQSGTDALLIAVSPVNDVVVWASGSKGTWIRTTNGGGTWITGQVAGAESLQFRDVHAVDSLTAYLLSIGNGPDSRIYKTTDGGTSWALQFTNPDSAAFFDCFDFWDEQRGIAISDAVNGETVMITTADGGTTWTRIPAADLPPAIEGEGSFAASGTCVIARPGGKAWVSTKGRVFLTSNYGKRWNVADIPVTHGGAAGIFSLAFRDAQFGAAFAADGAADPEATDTLLAVTVDGGVTWAPRPNPPLKKGTWAGAHIPGLRRSTLMAVGPSGAAWSADDGMTWKMLDTLNYWGLAAMGPKQIWAVGREGRVTKITLDVK